MERCCRFLILVVLVISDAGLGDAQRSRRPAFQNQDHCATADLRYRQPNGTCNHWKGYGASGRAVKRYIRPHYHDGQDSPRAYSILGRCRSLPSPRLISRNLHPDKTETSKFTLLVMQFGQLIDHDMTMAPKPSDTNQTTKCCDVPERIRSPQCFPIPIPPNDPVFTTGCMEFVRSDPALDRKGRQIFPREQTNELTSFLDASSIYGNDQQTMLKLRTQKGKGALLKTRQVLGKTRLPKGQAKDCQKTSHPLSYCMMAGDERVNEQPGLSSIHLIFHVQHNHIVRSLVKGILRKRSRSRTRSAREPRSREVDNFLTRTSIRMKETLFEETRKIMSGILQKITYCDWLPIILGPALIKKYGLRCDRESVYDPFVDPRISNVFLTAAFRFGHSLIPNHILVDNEPKGLPDMFEVPDPSLFHHESIVHGLCEGNMSRPFDRFVSHAVTSSLFQTSKKSLDLIALNIQRGRDHGIASYYNWRKHYGLRRMDRPEQLAPTKLAKKIRKLFDHMRDVDLFTAGLLEKPVRGGMVGETFGNILAQQFSEVKHGDAYFFLSTEKIEGFTKAQRKALLQVKIGQLMCSNANLGLIQINPFKESNLQNPLIPCRNIPELDLAPWVNRLS